MASSDDNTVATVINRNTLIPISIAVSVIISFLAAWGWLNSQFMQVITKIDIQIKASNQRFDQYDRRLERVEALANGSRSYVDALLWVSEFRRLNPEMKIPDVKRD